MRRELDHGHSYCDGFNPRIRKGCDSISQLFFYIFKGFNPRIRKGCDLGWQRLAPQLVVSIHASVKDATSV